jgi:hypothetical protein
MPVRKGIAAVAWDNTPVPKMVTKFWICENLYASIYRLPILISWIAVHTKKKELFELDKEMICSTLQRATNLTIPCQNLKGTTQLKFESTADLTAAEGIISSTVSPKNWTFA